MGENALLRGSGQDMVSSWEKTPSLLENHVKCISSSCTVHHLGWYQLHQYVVHTDSGTLVFGVEKDQNSRSELINGH